MKLSRKWFLVIALVMSMAVATGGTLAYLTDRDSEVNVFTVGNVSIKLNETFDQGAELMPGSNIAKEPTITNTGSNDAWVWVTIAIPSALDNDDPSKNVIHFNYSGESVADGLWQWTDSEGKWMTGTAKNGEIEYNVYTVLYGTALKPGETTVEPVIYKVYMDHHIDIDPNGQLYHVENGVAEKIEWNVNTQGNPMIFVSAYAVQTNEFATVADAYAAYIDQWTATGKAMDAVEWADPTAAVTIVDTVDELAAALAAGGNVTLAADIELDADAPITIPAGAAVTLNLNGKTLSATSDEAKASCVVTVAKGAELTIKNGTITYESAQPDSVNYSYGTNTINNSGTLVIDGATIINTTDGGSSNAIDNAPGAVLVVNSGKLESKKIAIRIRDNASVTINGGEITGARAVQIHLFQNVKAPTTLIINGGTFTTTNEADPLAVYSYAYNTVTFEQTTIEIHGGTFNGNVIFGAGNKDAKETVTITGGTFNGELGRYLANDGWEDIAKPTQP